MIIILVLTIALIIGPVLMMQPSKRSRQLAELRTKAADLGLSVKLGQLPGNTQSCAIYTLAWPSYIKSQPAQNWMLLKHNFAHEIHCAEHWDWQHDGRPNEHVISQLKQLLEQLPDSVLAIEANSLGISCYWQELGGVKTLETISHWLDDAVTAIALPQLPAEPPAKKRS